MIKIWPPDEANIIDLARKGLSASKIREQLGLDVSVRQIQRITKPYRAEQCVRARVEELGEIRATVQDSIKYHNEGDEFDEGVIAALLAVRNMIDRRLKELSPRREVGGPDLTTSPRT